MDGEDPSESEDDTSDDETSSTTTESSTDDDDGSSCYETVPESPPPGEDDDSDNSPPCAGACAITVEYDDDESDLSGSETSSATIMDLREDPHLQCCISHPGALGNPLGDRAVERLSGIVYPGDDADSPSVMDKHRFCVHRVLDDQHVILDSTHSDDEGVLIDTHLLQRSEFAVDQWYWRNRAEACGRSSSGAYKAELLRVDFAPPMGRPVEEHIILSGKWHTT